MILARCSVNSHIVNAYSRNICTLVGVISLFSFLTTTSPIFLSYMMQTCKSLTTSLFTTSKINGLSILWDWLTVFTPFLSSTLCMHTCIQILRISVTVHPMDFLCFLKISTNFPFLSAFKIGRDYITSIFTLLPKLVKHTKCFVFWVSLMFFFMQSEFGDVWYHERTHSCNLIRLKFKKKLNLVMTLQ